MTHQIPLVIGVTGHRNLHPEEIDLLRKHVRQIFTFLRQHYSDTPLLLLSPLAEGADRLVAKVALEENIRLIAPLPLPKDEYLKDFKTTECTQEFNELLARAEDWFELPSLHKNVSKKNRTERNIQYALVGAYVARHCHILIALWDGRETDNIGGTYQVMQLRLTGTMKGLPEEYKPPQNPLDFVETGKICHLKVSRANDPIRLLDAGDIRILSPKKEEDSQPQLEALLSADLEQLNAFNREVRTHTETYGEIHFDKPILRSETLEQLPKPFQTLSTVYEIASYLSIHYHRRTEWALKGIFSVGVLMVLAIELYAHAPWTADYPAWLLGCYLGFFALAYLIVWKVERRDLPIKYLHYRAFAEALRVQMFWQLGGLKESVADFYLRQHRGELDWVRSSVRALCTYNWVADQQSMDVVQNHWIEKQLKYFEKRLQGSRRWLRATQWGARVLFSVGFGLALGLFLFNASLHDYHVLHKGLIILMVLLPAAGAALDDYAEKRGFNVDTKRYSEIVRIFRRAKQLLEEAKGDLEKQQRVLLELGKAALEENSEWVLLHRDRPLELPKGG
jgi:hypothetical protein